jgi:2,4-dienoyl-CoA reductase-like NADH-dependent reductase (Old Yellow Enzyme family)
MDRAVFVECIQLALMVERGGKIFLQLGHAGSISHPDFMTGAIPVGPSALNPI